MPETLEMRGVRRDRWYILAAVLAGTIMGPVDGSVVNIALPTIATIFGADLGLVAWVSMSYLLVASSLLLTYGRLGDMYGYRPVYLTGLMAFVLTSALCGLSWNIHALIFFRALQAVGAGMTLAVAPAIITHAFPASERGRALGINAMSVAVGLALGPSLGGFLVDAVGWRSIFYINLPIGLVAFYFGWRLIPRHPGQRGQAFDLTGAALAFFALTGILVAVSRGQTWGWLSPFVLGSLGAGLVFLVLFLYTEQRVPQPMLNLGLFSNRLFSAANLAALCNFSAQYVMLFLTPFYLQNLLNYSPRAAGVVMTAFPLVTLFVAPVSGTLSDRFGTRLLSTMGAAICTLALWFMRGLGPGLSGRDVAWRLAIFGLGTGLFQSPNNSAVMGSVTRSHLGIASGTLATVRNVGMVLGIALAQSSFAGALVYHLARLAGTLSGQVLQQAAYAAALHSAYLVGAAVSLAGTLASWTRPGGRQAAAQETL
ncbi:MFS transporter [Gelria sp. Kuro-4]|uniref:MFS transporter n=1 Tax=Gelria sp. Kuro-4 TaxID=2796927 RepID=UPI001BEFED8A|nr:MFS transporter [Gelria sp. Kuro-4]BCV23753.1 MFS transporter [Gelria sp. Kuro-4]